MSVLNQLASFQNRRDEVPNQELARKLVAQKERDGIKEIAVNLENQDPAIQNDCIKVLYEIGYLEPQLITEFVTGFLHLLKGKNNRLIWGAMIALSTIAGLKAKEIYDSLDLILKAIETGSVITVDNGIKTLAGVAAAGQTYNQKIFPLLISHLKTCRPKEVPQHAEKIAVAVNRENRPEFLEVLGRRESDLTATQLTRIRKIIKTVNAI